MSDKLRKAREAKGLTQLQAAKLVGVTGNAWALWERDERFPRRENRLKITKVLGVPFRNLM